MAEQVRFNPVEGWAERMAAASWDGATLGVEPVRARVTVRLSPAARPPVEALLGVGLPGVGGVADSGFGPVLGLGPDEWLVVGDEGEAARIEAALREAAGAEAAIVDTSEGRVGVRLSGPAARDVLASCVAIDLHPSRFGSGNCAQTLLAKVPVLIHQLDDLPTYCILARPSMASYVVDWLVDAMRISRVAPA